MNEGAVQDEKLTGEELGGNGKRKKKRLKRGKEREGKIDGKKRRRLRLIRDCGKIKSILLKRKKNVFENVEHSNFETRISSSLIRLGAFCHLGLHFSNQLIIRDFIFLFGDIYPF